MDKNTWVFVHDNPTQFTKEEIEKFRSQPPPEFKGKARVVPVFVSEDEDDDY
tara:strand:+ start:45226 stop:45381 length:156 start_codon:yes stop_codon:yes gene_type:complete